MLRAEQGMYELDYKAGQIELLTVAPEFMILLHDSHEDFYWTTDGNSLFKEMIRDGRVKRDTVITDAQIDRVLYDSEGNVWFRLQWPWFI